MHLATNTHNDNSNRVNANYHQWIRPQVKTVAVDTYETYNINTLSLSNTNGCVTLLLFHFFFFRLFIIQFDTFRINLCLHLIFVFYFLSFWIFAAHWFVSECRLRCRLPYKCIHMLCMCSKRQQSIRFFPMHRTRARARNRSHSNKYQLSFGFTVSFWAAGLKIENRSLIYRRRPIAICGAEMALAWCICTKRRGVSSQPPIVPVSLNRQQKGARTHHLILWWPNAFWSASIT